MEKNSIASEGYIIEEFNKPFTHLYIRKENKEKVHNATQLSKYVCLPNYLTNVTMVNTTKN